MTIHCAERMDGAGDARTDISAIKIFVPAAYERVVDRAIQVWGAAGVSGDCRWPPCTRGRGRYGSPTARTRSTRS